MKNSIKNFIYNSARYCFQSKKRVVVAFFIVAATVSVAYTAGAVSAAESVSDFVLSVFKQNTDKKSNTPGSVKNRAHAATSFPQFLTENTLSAARSGHRATALTDGNVLITGGDAGGTAEIFNPAAGISTPTNSLLTARSGHAATRLADGRVLITGGTSGNAAVSSTEIYDPATATFSAGATMNAARSGHTATVLTDGKILIAGGDAGGSAEIFDAAAGTFTNVGAAMNASRSGHSAARLNDGRVLIVSGADTDGEELNSAEIFNPEDSSFTATGNQMTHHRVRPFLRVLPDGKAQIIGSNHFNGCSGKWNLRRHG